MLATAVLMAGCAAPKQGYGVAEPSAAALARQQFERAEQATDVDPARTYLNLIVQMQQANQWYASLAHTAAYEQQYGLTPQLLLLRANALRQTGQAQDARPIYEGLLRQADMQLVAQARRGLGLIHAQSGELSAAIAELEQARQLHPIDADILSDLAYAHMLDGDLTRARMPMLQASQLAPANLRVQLNLALFLMASGDQTAARELLAKLRTAAQRNATTVVNEQSIQALRDQALAIQRAASVRLHQPSIPVAAEPSASPVTPPLGQQATSDESHAQGQTSAAESPAPHQVANGEQPTFQSLAN